MLRAVNRIHIFNACTELYKLAAGWPWEALSQAVHRAPITARLRAVGLARVQVQVDHGALEDVHAS